MNSIPYFTHKDWTVVSTSNLGGDPNGDVLWQNIADQSLVLWQQDGATTTSITSLPSVATFDVVTTGDLDGDGISDPLLEPTGIGGLRKVLLSSSGTIENFSLGGTNWMVRSTIDGNQDGMDDVVWYNTASTNLFVGQMNGASQVGSLSFSSGYTSADTLFATYSATALDSFTSLWLDNSTGEYNIAAYDAGIRSILDTFQVNVGRSFLDSGDFDRDGNEDFVFRDQQDFGEGDIEIVFTNDNGIEQNRLEYDADFFFGIDFQVAGDFDNDGRTELLSVDAESDEQTVFNAIGSDQFAREIVGGNNADLIDGREGNDSIFGRDGNDILLGNDGRDWIFTGNGDDRANGGIGDDTLVGDEGDDTLSGNSGNDMIGGGPGRDTLEAGNGTDFLSGGEGDDYLVGGAFGFDHLRGGAGEDLLRGGSDRGVSEGGAGNDTLIGSSSNDVMFGGFGDDYLVGGLSQDTIFGGSGDDIIFGVDVAGTSGTDDTAYGGSGSDYFYLGNDDGNFYTGSGELYIRDFSTSTTSGDWLMLNGTASNYTYFDAGSTIQVRQSSDSNIIAVIDTTATATAVSAKAIYIG